ncbi:response regulator [Xylophilus sp. Kf1]|nr:response regulator [Xylophilus sp. Kf1]
MARILIVDDDTAFRETLAETLESLGHQAVQAPGGEAALHRLLQPQEGRIDAVFLDHRMPGMDGLQTLQAMNARLARLPPVIVLTAHASGGNTIESMRLGAFDHLDKPIRRDAVVEVLARALRQESAAGPAAPVVDGQDDELVGASPAMREVHKRIGLAADSLQPVLVLGETGTGKELVARALHRYSSRAGRPFVAINCSAIPKDLLESELFGHVRGAFSGATADRAGCFRSADGGVLLMDEIGDMDLGVQAKILRVLQEGEVTPLGGHRTVKVDVRIVAATHRDLAAEVAAGRFRQDLFYRLDVLSIRLPPLRERGDDILPLAAHFLQRAAAPQPPRALSEDALQALRAHPWPGNVRELRNLMERCHALVRHRVIRADDLALGAGPAAGATEAGGLPAAWADAELPAAVEQLERLLIQRALTRAGGNRAEAARALGIHRQLLYRKLETYRLG